jgi:DNA helicase-2/ATP-dependent DNA helicase PcrA
MIERIAVFGPPGTGKTTKILSMMEDDLRRFQGTIYAVSFTKNAAKELVSRLSEKEEADRIMPSTIHSLCFRHCDFGASSVMRPSDWNKIGKSLGIKFAKGAMYRDELGDAYLKVMAKAAAAGLPSKVVYNKMGIDHPYIKYLQFVRTLANYKEAYGMIDFNDMLLESLHRDPVDGACLYVDEAQDLSALQWAVLRHWEKGFKKVVIAGDDDQSIHAWAGADSDAMGEWCDKNGATKIVLNKSYRLPKKIWTVSNAVIKGVAHRVDKPYLPSDDEGLVKKILTLSEAKLDPHVDTFILGRSRRELWELAAELEALGLPYRYSSTDQGLGPWERVMSKVSKALQELKTRKEGLGKTSVRRLERIKEGLSLNISNWDRYLELPQRTINYMRSYLNDQNSAPKIILSTVHASKGSEADVVVFRDRHSRTAQQTESLLDSELRVSYVAITRAKKKLFILQTDNPLICGRFL